MKDLVSVIVPTYSRPVNLLRAIDSILNQTYRKIEIIIVDDNGLGSNEQVETYNILSEYIKKKQVIYFPHEKNINGSAARNTGLSLAKGKYISFLDDDDEFHENKIEIQVKALKELDNSWGGCYCNTTLIGKRKIVLNNKKSGNLVEDLLLGTVRFNTSSLLLRKEVCEDLNGFDVSFERHQDWEFMMRYFRKYKIYLPTTNSLLNKYSSRKLSSNFPNSQKFIKVKKQFLETFETDINIIKSSDKIYHEHWMQVASCLLAEKKYKQFLYYLKLSNSYSKITLNDLKSLTISLILGFIK